MKNMIRLFSVIFLLLLISGCKTGNVRHPQQRQGQSPLYDRYMTEGKNAETKKDLAKALDYYNKALIAARSKSPNQVEAHQSVLRIERKMNEAKRYCQEYKRLIKAGKHSEAERALNQARQIWPFYPECNNLAPISTQSDSSTQNVGSYRILNEKPVIHKIRRGDIISKLCQKYYGLTKGYQLVHIVTHYNKIKAKSLYRGQKIKFPSIELSGNIYRPKGSRPTPTPTPPPEPTVTPTPTSEPDVTPTPTPEPVPPFNQATELFRKGLYDDAITLLKNVSDTSPEKKESLRLLAQCHFRLAHISMEKERYREARDTFHRSLEICQRLRGTDLPSECEQIDDLVTKCDARIKTDTLKVHFDKGKQLLNANRIDPAIAEFDKVLALEPRHSDTLEYLYLAHFRKANRLWEEKTYQQALEEFMTAWEYNQNCDECQSGINKIKGILYRKAKALEKKYNEPNPPFIKIFQEQIKYYTIINQIDPNYEDVAKRLKIVLKRKETLLKTKNKQTE
ncbi:tetratricopeptide repeat protein [Desulfococcaceae bacterium HSG9]|nr:tetratricopeptide repeat protein [Desulfococcaceae bacterium HSG9]